MTGLGRGGFDNGTLDAGFGDGGIVLVGDPDSESSDSDFNLACLRPEGVQFALARYLAR